MTTVISSTSVYEYLNFYFQPSSYEVQDNIVGRPEKH